MTDDLPILWRDEHLIAIHKPAGWLVHRTGLDAQETRFVVQTLRGQLGGRHVHPVHRLDKGTCGVLLLALHPEAASRMARAFEAQAVHKTYLALVRGWAPVSADVDHALRPDDAPADAPAQPARTRFRRLATLEIAESADGRFPTTRASLVEAQPHSGRRHQIRRHLKHLAHPILGDATHGKGPLNRWWAERLGRQRLWLHACTLGFRHPWSGAEVLLHSGLGWQAGTGLSASAEAPDDLQHWQALTRQLPPCAEEGASPASGWETP
ncbi:tRNA pseudouridine synthase C [Sphaerotilus hippei]|uniref:tRNA pseudouridine synthase C n=1 Tax=Sphaerotilus hippei TaxID=744406 RepID=A0A318GYV1_9BURK|nr:pseudouridine synthase [Sphaerotilus hippei]PXW93982.1 tRNA pseudouridine synthase C [Sphaerotilus hippei]